jgi:hypothetical protein
LIFFSRSQLLKTNFIESVSASTYLAQRLGLWLACAISRRSAIRNGDNERIARRQNRQAVRLALNDHQRMAAVDQRRVVENVRVVERRLRVGPLGDVLGAVRVRLAAVFLLDDLAASKNGNAIRSPAGSGLTPSGPRFAE